MTLDQVLSAAPHVPGAFQSAEQRLSELRADVFALAEANGGGFHADAFQNRPSILRRVAGLLAGALPAGVDRLLCAQSDGIAVTTALALHTGLPFVTVVDGEGLAQVSGEAHVGEQVAVIAPVVTTGTRAAELIGVARNSGMRVTGVFSILHRGGKGAAVDVLVGKGVPLHTLFTDRP